MTERFEALKAKRKEWLYQRIEQLQEFLAGTDPVTLISIDGVQTQFDREGARKELESAWDQLGKIEGTRPGMTTIEMN
ncbi:MAG: hypothetical protein IKE69_01565 [Thermoguttaceae bacterium]|nr:hypothetical protein [Thermoguttaceae bacterium]